MTPKTKKIEKALDIASKFYKLSKIKNALDIESIVTPLQMDALMYLHKHPMSTVSRLGKYLNLSSSAVAQLTDRLAVSGFIARKDDPHDRRIVRLILTEKGKQIFKDIYKEKINKVKMVAPFLSDKDLNDLTRIYSKIFKKIRGRNNEK